MGVGGSVSERAGVPYAHSLHRLRSGSLRIDALFSRSAEHRGQHHPNLFVHSHGNTDTVDMSVDTLLACLASVDFLFSATNHLSARQCVSVRRNARVTASTRSAHAGFLWRARMEYHSIVPIF